MQRPLFLLSFLLWVGLTCQAQSSPARTLSLNDAILLAMRENPNVQRQQLSHVSEKYALELTEWQFKPHYFLDATKTTSQQYSTTTSGLVTQNTTAINPKVTLKTIYGTDITLNATNNIGSHYNPTVAINITQPLLKGFGRPIVEAELLNAMDSEKISRLNVEDTLRATVTNVINTYLDVISAQKTLEVDQNALKRAQKSVEQTKLFIKAGHKAGVELVPVEAEAANSETRIESDKNALAEARMRLLQTIGLDPNTNVIFTDIHIPALIKKYSIPALADAKKLVIEHDVSYQAAQITYEGVKKRSLVIAEDNTRWKLDVIANAATGSSGGGGPNAGINSLVNGVNRTDSVVLNLSIPIDDRSAKIGFENAKIALRQAEIGLKEQKWGEETKAINAWNTIFSAERSLKLSEQAEMLQQKTYNIYEQKYNYGLIDSLELQSTRQQYMASQQQFLSQQMNYLKALVSLDQLIGRTLETWHIQVNYG
jgi:outer membrane protein TolC